MKLNRVHETLGLIERQESVTVQDALDLFYDLYEDIKTTEGNVLEQQPLGDRDGAVGRLCWMARTVARIYSRNAELIQAPEYASRWEKAEEKLSEAMAALSSVEEEALKWQAHREKLDTVLASVDKQQEKAALERELCRQREEQIAYFKSLDEECQKIRGEIEENRTQKLPLLEEQKQKILEESAVLKEVLEKQEEENEQQRQRMREMEQELQEQKAALEQENQKQKETLERQLFTWQEEQHAMENQLEEVKEQIRTAEGEIKGLQENIRSERANQEAIAAECETARNQYEERLRESEEARKRLENMVLSYEEPLKEAEYRAGLLRKCIQAWEEDNVLKKDWPSDQALMRKIGTELEKTKNETECALNVFHEKYNKLVECLEKGGMKK